MIEGLKFDFSGEELIAHLRTKAAHHAERRDFYVAQAKALRDGGAEAAQYTGGDPVRSLKESADKHENRRSFFTVLADHTDKAEVYRLTEIELATLEVISRHFG